MLVDYQLQFGKGASSDALRVCRDFHPLGKIKNPNFVRVSACLVDLNRKQAGTFFGGMPVMAFIGTAPSARWKHSEIKLLECRKALNPSVGLTRDTIKTFLQAVFENLKSMDIDVPYAYSSLKLKQTGHHWELAGWERLGYRSPTNDIIRIVWSDGRTRDIPRQTMNAEYGSSSAGDLNAGVGLIKPLPRGTHAERIFDEGKLLHAAPITSKGVEWAEIKNLLQVDFELQALPPNVFKLISRLRGEVNG